MKRIPICAFAAGLAAMLALSSCGGVPSGITEDRREPVQQSTPLEEGATPLPEMDLTPSSGGTIHEAPVGTEAPNMETIRVTLHYITDDGYVLPVRREIPREDGIAMACLSRLTKGTDDAELSLLGLNAPIPEGTRISLAIAGGEARVDLSGMPQMQSEESERALFASIVNTLTQFRSVDRVSITVNGQHGRTENGSALPTACTGIALNVEDDSVAASASGTLSELTLYFPNEQGSAFIPVTRYVNGESGLYASLSRLAGGTKLEGLRCCFPENTLILGAAIENGVLSVNCSGDFLKINEMPGLYSLAMQSALLTASPFGSIDEIRFLVNGAPFEPVNR